MADWRYDDFVTIREDFIPVFTQEVDRQNTGNWKAFIPHDQTRNLLETLITALERGKVSDCKSVWLTGPYGTGKTFTCFVVKHLLEDPLEEVRDYFEKHDVLKNLWPRFKALRQKRYLVVYRSGSGHIKSSRRLYLEIEQAIKEGLASHGYSDTFTEGIMQQLINRLTAEDSILNWEGIFKKNRGAFQDVSTPEGVIRRLHSGDLETGEKVAAVLEREGVSIKDSPESIKEWIKAVIERNELGAILFIWDEFTQFFAGSTDVDALQELAHGTTGMPFYLFLVTHRTLDQFSRIDEGTRKKLHDRFHLCKLEMEYVTAYKLIGNVIEPKSGRGKEWEEKRDTLWSAVDRAVLAINILGQHVRKDELKTLCPIHPYSAYLLSAISSHFSSSQRTLFQFLKGSEPGSFRSFTANYPKDNWYWLTPDYLWEYFFDGNKVESMESIADLLTHYSSNKDKLSEEELRVFRVMLLLSALNRQSYGRQPLFKPSLLVLKHMFTGTELSTRVSEVASQICDKGIMLAVPNGSDVEYDVPSTTIDRTKLDQYKQQIKVRLSFENMIADRTPDAELTSKIKELLSLRGASQLRHPVQLISAKEFKTRGERIVRAGEYPYEVSVVMVVAQEDEDLYDTDNVALRLTKARKDQVILISQCPFESRRWSEWIDDRAYQWYYEDMRDGTKSRYYATKSEKVLNDWLTSVRLGEIKAFFGGRVHHLSGCESVPNYLEYIASQIYPFGPEQISKTATLYTSSWGKTGAEIGLKIARPFGQYKEVVEVLERLGLWEGKALANSKHPLGEMKRAIDVLFEKEDHVGLDDIWDKLQQPPFGLMPSPIGILLFSFLMRDYAEGYYYSDGTNSLPLNPNKLAEIIHDVMKRPRVSSYTIRRMSLQAEKFCRVAADVFHLRPEQSKYPEEARKNIRDVLISIGFPLWCVKYACEETLDPTLRGAVSEATEVLSNIISYDVDELSDEEMSHVCEVLQPVRT